MSIDKKRIRIPYNGPILAKGGIYGPIQVPYIEDVSLIGAMLLSNIPIVEVLDNGKETTLTLQNYNHDIQAVAAEREALNREIEKERIEKEKAEAEAARKAQEAEASAKAAEREKEKQHETQNQNKKDNRPDNVKHK